MLSFILDHLLVIILICIVIFVILPFVLDIFSTIITIVVVVAVLGFLGIFGPNFVDNVQKPIAATKTFVENTIQPTINEELKDADFTYDQKTNKYTIKSTSFKLEGVSNENKATIWFKENSYTIDVSFLKGFIQQQIEQTQNK